MTATSRAVLAVHDALERGRTTAAEFIRLWVFAAVVGVPFAAIRRALRSAQESLSAGAPYDEMYRSVLAVMSSRQTALPIPGSL